MRRRRLPRCRPIAWLASGLLVAAVLRATVAADEPVSSAVRYNREIVRIFARKCVACHAKGGLSVPLESYHDVTPWARAIREEILERRMPPWPSAHGVRPLANDLSLTAREIAIINAWVDGGTPRGDPADLPPLKPRMSWPAGEPDLKLPLPAQRVAGDQRTHVRRVTVPTDLARERWLRGFDITPGDRRALRSVFLSVKHSDGREQWLGGWTPWYAMTSMPSGVASRLPANSVLIVELHYTTGTESGQLLSDSSTLGLYFQPRPPAVTLQDFTVAGMVAETDPSRRRLHGEMTLDRDVVLWALRPRLAKAGDAGPGTLEVKAIRPDGGVESLLWVKENRPDWQLPYVFRDPVALGRGSRLVVVAYPAASEENPTVTVSMMWYEVPIPAVQTAGAPITARRTPLPPRR